MIDSSLSGIIVISAEADGSSAKKAAKKKSVIISAHGCVPSFMSMGVVYVKGVSKADKLHKMSSPVLTYALPGVSLSGDVVSAIKGNDQPTTSFVSTNFALNYYENDWAHKILEWHVTDNAPKQWCDLVILKDYTKCQYSNEGKFIVKMTLQDVIDRLIQGGYNHASYLGHFCWYTGGEKSMQAQPKTSTLTTDAQKVVKFSPVTSELKEFFKKK